MSYLGKISPSGQRTDSAANMSLHLSNGGSGLSVECAGCWHEDVLVGPATFSFPHGVVISSEFSKRGVLMDAAVATTNPTTKLVTHLVKWRSTSNSNAVDVSLILQHATFVISFVAGGADFRNVVCEAKSRGLHLRTTDQAVATSVDDAVKMLQILNRDAADALGAIRLLQCGGPLQKTVQVQAEVLSATASLCAEATLQKIERTNLEAAATKLQEQEEKIRIQKGQLSKLTEQILALSAACTGVTLGKRTQELDVAIHDVAAVEVEVQLLTSCTGDMSKAQVELQVVTQEQTRLQREMKQAEIDENSSMVGIHNIKSEILSLTMKRDGYEKDRRRLEADLQQCDADCCSLQVLLDSIKIKAQEASREGDASILKSSRLRRP